jgi:hypothetical protein
MYATASASKGAALQWYITPENNKVLTNNKANPSPLHMTGMEVMDHQV